MESGRRQIVLALLILSAGLSQEKLDNIPLCVINALLPVVALILGSTHFIFANRTRYMKTIVLGIPVSKMHFAGLYEIGKMPMLFSSYYFRVLTRDNKYGNGITLSSLYRKEKHPNAIAFSKEVIAVLQKWINQAAPIPKQQVITEYQYFHIRHPTAYCGKTQLLQKTPAKISL